MSFASPLRDFSLLLTYRIDSLLQKLEDSNLPHSRISILFTYRIDSANASHLEDNNILS